MKICDIKLKTENDALVDLLEDLNADNRDKVSSRIIVCLRNFVEHIFIKLYCEDNQTDLDDEYCNIEKAKNYCKQRGQYTFLNRFYYKHLYKSSGHKTIGKDYSEALMLLYYDTLIDIKAFMKRKYNFDVLQNIEKYPLDLDDTYLNHYRKIWDVVSKTPLYGNLSQCENTDTFYVQKKKRLYFDGHLMYEFILTPPSESVNKFDRFVAFSLIDIFKNYAISASIIEKVVSLFDVEIPIKIINAYDVSIRQCELNNLAKIVGSSQAIDKKQLEYKAFMDCIKNNHTPLNEYLAFSNRQLDYFVDKLKEKRASAFPIVELIKKAKRVTDSNLPGTNVLKYLMYSMKNKDLKAQYCFEKNADISNLYLKNGTRFFDTLPFCTNLIDSKQSLRDVFDCIDLSGRECQLLAREIANNSNNTGQLFTKPCDLNCDDIETIISSFNNSLTSKSEKLRIENIFGNLCIQENEIYTKHIIQRLLLMARTGIPGYSNQASSWVLNNTSQIFGKEKPDILIRMFDTSRVFLIYGAAGTGKSTIIRFVFKIFGNINKLCLAPTYPSLENMQRRIDDPSANYLTIHKFINNDEFYSKEYDVVVIDECSMVGNRIMNDFLQKIKTKVLILSGDIYQIPSIDFGNWFYLAKDFLPEKAKCELLEQFRTENDVLKMLWTMVRKFDPSVPEYLTNKRLVTRIKDLDNSFFEKMDDDEIILCLNYDGLYGVNSINSYLQTKNPNTPVKWYQYTFKVGDPILFSDIKRFDKIVYNNLKGIIYKIDLFDDRITFKIAIDRRLSSVNFGNSDIHFVEIDKNGWTVVEFSVYNHTPNDFDNETNVRHIVPFHVAYAASIHKAQGLEYNSVKIMISNSVEEKINHNIFYTAITRAKQKLMIYWTPETEKTVFSNFQDRFNDIDYLVLKKYWGF